MEIYLKTVINNYYYIYYIKYRLRIKITLEQNVNKMNIRQLIVGVIFGIIAQIIVFFQLQGPMKYDWFKNKITLCYIFAFF